MARTHTTPALTWLNHLYEVGRPITRMADEEAEILAEIEGLKRQIEARKRDIGALRERANDKVRGMWSAEEIETAKLRAEKAKDEEVA